MLPYPCGYYLDWPSHPTAFVQNLLFTLCAWTAGWDSISNLISLSDESVGTQEYQIQKSLNSVTEPSRYIILKQSPWPSLLFFLETGKQSTHPQQWCPGPCPSEWIYPLQRTTGSMETPLYNHTGKSAQQQNCLITLKIPQVPSVILNEIATEFHKILTQLLTNSEDAWSNSVQKKLHEIKLNKGKNGPKSFSLSHSGKIKPDAP